MWKWFDYTSYGPKEDQEKNKDFDPEDEDENDQKTLSVKCLIVLDGGESQIPMDVPANELDTLFDVFEFTQKAIHSGENPLSVKKIERSRNCYWYDTVVFGRGVVIGFDKEKNQCIDYDPTTVYLPTAVPTMEERRRKRVNFKK